MTAEELGEEIIRMCDKTGWPATKAADFISQHGIVTKPELLALPMSTNGKHH
jgi:hypothetical protein